MKNLINNEIRIIKNGEIGVVTESKQEFDNIYLTVKFDNRVSIFNLNTVLMNLIEFTDESLNNDVIDYLNERIRLKNEETVKNKQIEERKNFESKFDTRYNSQYFRTDQCFKYNEVEQKYGIFIKGPGKGINYTNDNIILISKLDKTDGKIFHNDHFTLDGNYIYTGEGANGDQRMTGGNKELRDSIKNGKPIHLFITLPNKINSSVRDYFYQGVFTVISIDTVKSLGHDNVSRNSYQFTLQRA